MMSKLDRLGDDAEQIVNAHQPINEPNVEVFGKDITSEEYEQYYRGRSLKDLEACIMKMKEEMLANDSAKVEELEENDALPDFEETINQPSLIKANPEDLKKYRMAHRIAFEKIRDRGIRDLNIKTLGIATVAAVIAKPVFDIIRKDKIDHFIDCYTDIEFNVGSPLLLLTIYLLASGTRKNIRRVCEEYIDRYKD